MKLLKKYLKKYRAFFLALLAVFSLAISSSARAVDQGDIYLEAFGGLDVDSTRRILMGTTVGYSPWDEIGVGLTFEQAVAGKKKDTFDNSLRGAIEFRWFLEPWEFWLDTGYLVTEEKVTGATTKSGTINLGGAYLFSLTASMAIRLGVHIQFPYTADGTIFSTAALRVIW